MEGYAFCGEEAVALFQEFAEKQCEEPVKRIEEETDASSQEAEPEERQEQALIEESAKEDMEPPEEVPARARRFLLSRGLVTSGRRQQDTISV